MDKTCTICQTTQSLEFFHKNPGTKDGRGSQCKVCDKDQILVRSLEKKKHLVDYKGGKCCGCGYDKNYAALEFHHQNPDKEFSLSNLKFSLDRLKAESEKCNLMCSNCHRELHHPRLRTLAVHGIDIAERVERNH